MPLPLTTQGPEELPVFLSPLGGATVFFLLVAGTTALLLFHDGWDALGITRLHLVFLGLCLLYAAMGLLFFHLRRTTLKVLSRVCQLSAILGSLRDMVFVFSDDDLQLVYLNRAASDRTGFGATGLTGRTLTEVLPRVDRQELRRLVAQLDQDPENSLLFETDGQLGATVIPVEIQLQALATEHGARHCVASIRDISSRIQRARQVQEVEERFFNIFRIGPDPIAISTLEGVLVEVNTRFCELSGYRLDELIGQNGMDLGLWKDPGRDRQRLIDQVLSHGQATGMRAEFVAKDGSVMVGLVSAALVSLDDSPHLLLSVRDITGIEQMEAQLQASRNLEALAGLAGGIAHEFNNLLTSIIGYADLALDELAQDSQPARDLGQLLVKAHQAEDLVRQFSLFSHRLPDEGKTVLDLEPLVHEMIRHVERLSGRLVVESRIELSTVPVYADPLALRQALLHIVRNAVEAMDGQGRLIIGLKLLLREGRVDVAFPGLGEGDYAHLYFKDMGQGMDPLTLERVFDPFFTTKEMGTATGMGLSVVHGIVADHAGQIRVNSRKGFGSTVHLVLPIHGQGEIQASQTTATGNEHLLLVDDDAMLTALVVRFLEPLGYRVTVSSGGTQALAMLAAGLEVDLVLTDCRMPGMTGIELLDALQGGYPELPVLLMSGRQDEADRAEAVNRGARAILDKPLHRERLALTIRQVLQHSGINGNIP